MSDDLVTRLNAALEDRYAVERKLGEGGMATVYLATDLKHNRHVALKVLKPELAAVVGAERFLTEIETTANLQHPHILPLFDSGEADSFLYYVMPYVEGETLGDRIERERQLPVDEALGIATSVASALQHAHDRGVIHRDIKPGNILLQDGQPVVADFGIALAVGAAGGTRLTETGLSVGTPFYMSPEQATGDQVIGPASDTFALACVLYEMLVGEPPYPGRTAQAVLGKIIQGTPVSATAVRKSIPTNVDAAIRRALEKLPADRFTGAHDFAKALGDPGFRHGEEAAEAVAAGAGPWKRLAVTFATLAIGFAALSGWMALRPDAPMAVERFGSPFLEGQQPIGTDVALFNLSDDGSLLVYFGPGEIPGANQLWLRRWDDLEASPIRGTLGGIQPDISPDGQEVVFRRGGEILVVSLAGGPVRTLMRGRWPRWSSDGYIYAELPGVGSVRVPATGGPVDTVTVLAEGDAAHVVYDFLPGGEGALLNVILGGGGFETRTLELATGETAFLVPGGLPQYVETGHVVYLLDGTVMAAPFDAKSMELTGPVVSLVEGVEAAAVSRNGRLFYSVGGAGGPDRQLVWVTRSGQVTPVDPDWAFSRGDVNTGWSISPDGTRLVLREQTESGYDIWVKQLDDGPRSRLTFDDVADYAPRWTPDGGTITYVSGATTGLDVWSKQADGTGQRELLLDLDQSVALAIWSPDGEWLILRTTTGAGAVFGRDIYAIRPGVDSEPTPLLVAEYDETDPAVSPDGRWIAYTSNETDRYEVYVRPFPDVESGRWQISTEGGHRPLWAHSGTELFFKDGNQNMVAAQVDGTGESFRAESPEVLFPIPNDFEIGTLTIPYDVAPDDQRFIMARVFRGEDADDGGLPAFILVLNWGEELRARVRR